MGSRYPSETGNGSTGDNLDFVMREQVGGGYYLRRNINVTPNATPVSHSSKDRRAQMDEANDAQIALHLGDMDAEMTSSIAMDAQTTRSGSIFSSTPCPSKSSADLDFFRLGGFPPLNPTDFDPDLPITSRLPSQPPSTTYMSCDHGELEGNEDGEQGEENEIEDGEQHRKGRISTANHVVMDKAFEQVNQIFDETSAAIKRSTSSIISLWHKSNSHKRGSMGVWNKYQHYFSRNQAEERRRAGLPDGTCMSISSFSSWAYLTVHFLQLKCVGPPFSSTRIFARFLMLMMNFVMPKAWM